MSEQKKLRVLHLASEYPPARVYGLGRFVHGLARAQAAAGDDVLVLTNSSGGAEDDVVLEGVHVHRIEFPNPPRPADGQGEVLQWNHGVVARLLERRALFEDVDVIQGHDWLTALAAREIADLLGKPLVVTFHDEIVGKRFGLLEPEDRWVKALEALTAHDANHVIANSAYMAREVTRIYGLDSARVTAIPGGIDPTLLDVPSPEALPQFRRALGQDDELLVLFAGRLDPEKGLETLAEAWRRFSDQEPRARLLVAGSGTLEERARATLGDRARLLDYVERESLRYLYRAVDVVVVPSVYEPFGLVALEAMLAGRAVITSDAGGLAEIVRDGEDGLRFPAGDARSLAAALGRLARDPALRARLGQAAERRVREDFAWSAIAERTRQAYLGVVGQVPRIQTAEPPVPAPALVSAVLETDRAPVHLRALLRSLALHTRHPIEVSIVDRGPTDADRAATASAIEEARSLGLEVRAAESIEAALDSARGAFVLRLGDELEVPPGSEDWLSGLVWLLESTRATAVSPTLLDRAAVSRETNGPDPRSHRELRPEPPGAACFLVRVGDKALLRGDLPPGPHWRHPLPLVWARGEARRDPGAPYQAIDATGFAASVVLVAYQNRALTEEAIQAVLAHTAPPYELVLVDNGSSDGTRELFRSLERSLGGAVGVQVLRNEQNLGYPVAANQGSRAARGKHVVLLNNDTRVRPGWLTALLRAVESQDRVGLVTAKVLNLDGSVQSAGGIEHDADGGFEIPGQGEDRLAPTVNERRAVRNAGGPCLLLTRELLDELAPDGRPFDEAYSPGYFEDSDLCFRAREAGFTLLYEPGAELHHHGKATADLVAREGSQDVWGRFGQNELRFRSRWRGQLAADQHERRLAARALAETPRRQKIVLCYDRSQTTTAAFCERALRREHQVITAGRGQELDLGTVSARTLCDAAGGDVDLLLLVEGENYFPEELKDAPCPTAAWLLATHLHAHEDRGWHLDLARDVDHTFLAQKDYLRTFLAHGLEASWLPLACEPELHAQRGPREGRDLEVVFVGNLRPFHERRRRLLERLQRRFRVDVTEGAYLEDMARRFARARVVFNCSLAGDLNMRTFEALASGALLVTDRAGNGLEDLFADREHLCLYGDEDLEEVVARALADEPARAEIAERGQRLVLRHHSYRQRMRTLLAHVASQAGSRLRLVREVPA